MRHGQCIANTQPAFFAGRVPYSPLTLEGIQQAEMRGAYFRENKIGFDKVYSSAAVRAYETARLICREIQYPVNMILVDDGLAELSFGAIEGTLRDPITELYLRINFNLNLNGFKVEGGESRNDVAERMKNSIDSIMQGAVALGYKNTAIVSHGRAIQCWGKAVFGDDRIPVLQNAGIAKFGYEDGLYTLLDIIQPL